MAGDLRSNPLDQDAPVTEVLTLAKVSTEPRDHQLRELKPAGRHALIDPGSLAQLFKVFIPDADSPDKEPLRRLLANRYLGSEDTRPEIVFTDIEQLSDQPPPVTGPN